MKLFDGVVDVPTIRISAVRSYLLGKGWVLKPFPRKTALCFEGPLADDGEPIVQVIPASESFHDYPLRLEDLLRALSMLENRPISEILREMLSPPELGPVVPPTTNGAADGKASSR